MNNIKLKVYKYLFQFFALKLRTMGEDVRMSIFKDRLSYQGEFKFVGKLSIPKKIEKKEKAKKEKAEKK
jgi:hypothetical protein